jgi:hypothetical protein
LRLPSGSQYFGGGEPPGSGPRKNPSADARRLDPTRAMPIAGWISYSVIAVFVQYSDTGAGARMRTVNGTPMATGVEADVGLAPNDENKVPLVSRCVTGKRALLRIRFQRVFPFANFSGWPESSSADPSVDQLAHAQMEKMGGFCGFVSQEIPTS